MPTFSTESTLSRPIVAKWVIEKDIDTLRQWLSSGRPHPRLATEAIVVAVSQGSPDIAQLVWEAGWHKPTMVFEGAWQVLRRQYHGLTDPSQVAESRYGDILEWLIAKSVGATETKEAGHQNLSRIHGLRMAFNMPTPVLWDRLLSLGTDCGTAAGNDLLREIKSYVAWWPNPFAHEPVRVAQWAQDRAVRDLLAHGLRPGGSVWVGAMEKEVAAPLFETLLESAARITTPRQRLTIVLYAQHQGVLQERWERMLKVFMDLGMPTEVRLTPSELKRATQPDQRLAIAAMDAQYDSRSWTKQYYQRQDLFEFDTMVLEEPLRSRVHVQQRLDRLNADLPPERPRQKSPRF